MKSAYERALERHGGDDVQKLTEAQKTAIADIDSRYKAKIAQAELHYAARFKTASAAEADKLRDDMAVEMASLKQTCEREKDKIRKAT